MIQLKNVSKSFERSNNQIIAINNVNLTIAQSEIFGLIGQSGAGKSTLLRFINGLLKVDTGQVLVNGADVNQLNELALRKLRQRIAMVFQQFNVLQNLTVEQNVLLPLKIQPSKQALPLEQVLKAVGLLELRHRYPSQLSGGQKQRIGIARALITNPEIMLLDEPTSALDEQTSAEIATVLKEIHQTYQMTMIVVTHQLSLVQALCQRAAIIEHGAVLEVIDVKNQPQLKPNQSYYELVKEVLTNES